MNDGPEELKNENEIGEVGIVGGAVMCLAYKARPSTQDIDALFEPTKKIRSIVRKIGQRENLPKIGLTMGSKLS